MDAGSPPSPTAVSAPAIGPAYPLEVTRVIDGDTFEARVNVWPGLEVLTKVRLRGIDTAEMKGRCAAEQAKVADAREALARLLAQGEVAIRAVSLDKYGGRILASASSAGTQDIGAALLSAGLARPYAGGRRRGWCGVD